MSDRRIMGNLEKVICNESKLVVCGLPIDDYQGEGECWRSAREALKYMITCHLCCLFSYLTNHFSIRDPGGVLSLP